MTSLEYYESFKQQLIDHLKSTGNLSVDIDWIMNVELLQTHKPDQPHLIYPYTKEKQLIYKYMIIDNYIKNIAVHRINLHDDTIQLQNDNLLWDWDNCIYISCRKKNYQSISVEGIGDDDCVLIISADSSVSIAYELEIQAGEWKIKQILSKMIDLYQKDKIKLSSDFLKCITIRLMRSSIYDKRIL